MGILFYIAQPVLFGYNLYTTTYKNQDMSLHQIHILPFLFLDLGFPLYIEYIFLDMLVSGLVVNMLSMAILMMAMFLMSMLLMAMMLRAMLLMAYKDIFPCILQPDRFLDSHNLQNTTYRNLNMLIHQIHKLLPHQVHKYYICLDKKFLKSKF